MHFFTKKMRLKTINFKQNSREQNLKKNKILNNIMYINIYKKI